MNVKTLENVLALVTLGEKIYSHIRTIAEREKSGNPLTDAELDQLKTDSDAAHSVIQSWSPIT